MLNFLSRIFKQKPKLGKPKFYDNLYTNAELTMFLNQNRDRVSNKDIRKLFYGYLDIYDKDNTYTKWYKDLEEILRKL